uniref:Uncharacterized protein n=1 Tax=viral metagenome TaxID=1070528 RepID=A0A6C0KJR9_9ZZZZ
MNPNINLRKGQRYLFYEQTPYHENEISFRANFIAILGETLLVNASETERANTTLLSVPVAWITRIETLEDILTVDSISLTILPGDVLNIIDTYI